MEDLWPGRRRDIGRTKSRASLAVTWQSLLMFDWLSRSYGSTSSKMRRITSSPENERSGTGQRNQGTGAIRSSHLPQAFLPEGKKDKTGSVRKVRRAGGLECGSRSKRLGGTILHLGGSQHLVTKMPAEIPRRTQIDLLP